MSDLVCIICHEVVWSYFTGQCKFNPNLEPQIYQTFAQLANISKSVFSSSVNKSHISNPEMIEHLYESCKERLSLVQNDIKSFTDRLTSSSEVERKPAYYLSECHKPIVNRGMIERLRGAKRALPDDSPSVLPRDPNRPSASSTSSRPKRTKTLPKSQVYLFKS